MPAAAAPADSTQHQQMVDVFAQQATGLLAATFHTCSTETKKCILNKLFLYFCLHEQQTQ